MFFENRYMRTISRNAHYIVLFPNPRNAKMISTLGSQMFPGNSKFVASAFQQATAKSYGYLLIDLKLNVKHRLKTGVLCKEEPYILMCSDQSDND